MKSKTILILLLFLIASSTANSQVLISLLLGDKLNSGGIEFGLEGGYNFSDFHNLEESSRSSNFNLGFYFLIKMSEKSYLNTGVLVKQNMGAEGLKTYPIGDPEVDSLFADGSLAKRINYFQIPIMYHFRPFPKFYLEGGFQVALRYGGTDIFYNDIIEDNDVQISIDTKSEYSTLDAGLLGGLGYKFKNKGSGAPGMSLGAKYYYGLVDVDTDDIDELFNDSFYVKYLI
jgi:hypothetical protein